MTQKRPLSSMLDYRRVSVPLLIARFKKAAPLPMRPLLCDFLPSHGLRSRPIFVACCRSPRSSKGSQGSCEAPLPPDAAFTWDFYSRTHEPVQWVPRGCRIPLVRRRTERADARVSSRRHKQVSRLQRHATAAGGTLRAWRPRLALRPGRRRPARLAARRATALEDQDRPVPAGPTGPCAPPGSGLTLWPRPRFCSRPAGATLESAPVEGTPLIDPPLVPLL